MLNMARIMAVVGIALVCVSGAAQAQVVIDIDTVPVGNPGNAGELSGEGAGGMGVDRTCGAVAYTYRIGKYEVTNEQYRDFLNAVDPEGTNPYDLYNTDMGSGHEDTGGISFNPALPSGEKYSVREDRADRPVNYVTFWDACRFANWLHNEQGDGDTETGAYSLNGVTSPPNESVTGHSLDARFWIPTEDEWYKAAYYDPRDEIQGGPPGNDHYWLYPTQSDDPPISEPPPGSGCNSANYHDGVYPIDPPYYLTEVDAYACSDSYYGTFGQGGNVHELNEAIINAQGASYRGRRGGAYCDGVTLLEAAYRSMELPETETPHIGFRVAAVSESAIPTLSGWGLIIMAVLVLTAGAVVLRNRRTMPTAS